MDLHRPAGDSRDSAIHLHRRRSREAIVELAGAAALRLAPDHLLAGVWTSGAVPDPLRRIWMAPFRSLEFPRSHGRSHGRSRGRALGSHDAGGPGTIPATRARTLRLRPSHRREQGAMKTEWPQALR